MCLSVLIGTVAFAMIPASAKAKKTFDFEYIEVCGNTAKVVGLKGSSRKVAVPNDTTISKYISSCTGVKSVESVKIRQKVKQKWLTATFRSNKSAKQALKSLKKGTYKMQARACGQNGKKYTDWYDVKIVKTASKTCLYLD